MARTETTYTRDGFVVERGLLTSGEVEAINDAFMRMHASGGVPGRYEPPSRRRTTTTVCTTYSSEAILSLAFRGC